MYSYIKILYVRGLSLNIFITKVIKHLSYDLVSTFTYKISYKGTLSPLRHYHLYAMTYVTPTTAITPLPPLRHDLRYGGRRSLVAHASCSARI
jgi:hypothetical protein